MTGTSLDGLDVAYVEITGTELEMGVRVLATASAELGVVGVGLREIAEQKPTSAGKIAAFAFEFAHLHAQTIRDLVGGGRIDLACIHGQTVFHSPPQSWQLLQPAPIAAALRCPVVFDLRAADLACGGQGAPITPIADLVLFSHARERRAIVNLGGFANFTMLPPTPAARRDVLDEVSGGDICACNQLLDAIARTKLGQAFDEDGRAAALGRVNSALSAKIDLMLQHQSRQERSLGTGDDMLDTLRAIMGGTEATGADVARAACSGIARAIAAKVEGVERVLIAGGGARNKTLAAALQRAVGAPVEGTDVCGVAGEYREAVAMAVLGALCQDRVAITLPKVTRVPPPAPVAGAWVYPG